ncbi:hypothetical protein JD969_12990 [Planctomycetota bacterium]|nr:hypothetical protein JD969_12990 [Planctomycetota bacterium]
MTDMRQNRMVLKVQTWSCIALLMLMLQFAAGGSANASAQADQVIAAIPNRQTSVINRQASNPWPTTGSYRHVNYALGSYWKNQNIADADQGLVTYRDTIFQNELDDFHWRAYLLERIYFLYSVRSDVFPGRMGPTGEQAVLDMLWDWAKPNCKIELADTERIWWIWGSENHHLMAWASFWGAAHIFKDHPNYKTRVYDDGSTPAEMAAAFDKFFKLYFKERANKGLMIEVASPTYAKYSSNTLYNFADFADDPELKELASNFLNLYWTDWAIEQIDGVRGGSRHRCYPGTSSNENSSDTGQSWIHFGLNKRSIHPGDMCAATTFWRPSSVVVDLALNWEQRGEYEIVSRRPGLNAEDHVAQFPTTGIFPATGSSKYTIEPRGGALLRYSYCTPDFIMGMSMLEALQFEDWSKISSQNRWNGIIFAGHDTARVYTQTRKPSSGSAYNVEWGVQKKGVAIIQRLNTHANAVDHMVYFDKALSRIEVGGWIFAEAPEAYVAVHAVQQGGTWEADSLTQHHQNKGKTNLGDWYVLAFPDSPIIFEVGRKEDYVSFGAFQSEILGNQLSWTNNCVKYKSSSYDVELSLYTDYSSDPEVDGMPVDFTPPFTYKSPFMDNFNKTIKYDGDEVEYKFE